MTTHPEFMLTLGVFDDGDVLPTLIVGFLVPTDTCTGVQLLDAIIAYAEDLREEAAVHYGRPFPKHAEFWFCETREVPNDQLWNEVQRDTEDGGRVGAQDVEVAGGDAGLSG